MASPLHFAIPLRFSIDAAGSQAFDGYTFGGFWNGWEEPLVTRRTLLKVCEYFNTGKASEGDHWKLDGDTLVITNSVYDHEEKVTPRRIKVEGGRTLKLWDISLGYCWSEEV